MIFVNFSFSCNLEKEVWWFRIGGKGWIGIWNYLSSGRSMRESREEGCLLTTVVSTDLLKQNDI